MTTTPPTLDELKDKLKTIKSEVETKEQFFQQLESQMKELDTLTQEVAELQKKADEAIKIENASIEKHYVERLTQILKLEYEQLEKLEGPGKPKGGG